MVVLTTKATGSFVRSSPPLTHSTYRYPPFKCVRDTWLVCVPWPWLHSGKSFVANLRFLLAEVSKKNRRDRAGRFALPSCVAQLEKAGLKDVARYGASVESE